MVVRAVSVMFLSVYLMAGNHLTVSAANGEKISEDSDFSVSGENMDSLLNSLDLSRIEAFLGKREVRQSRGFHSGKSFRCFSLAIIRVWFGC